MSRGLGDVYKRQAPHRGAGNTPAQIANIVRAMAVERDQDLAELAAALSDNAERIFGSFAP